MQPPDVQRLQGSSEAFWERYNAPPSDLTTKESQHTQRTSRGPRLPYIAGLDGIRALAVIAVLIYHIDAAWLPGGFLGVEVFFVLSGYLITSLLLAEWRQNDRIDLVSFWIRRARRLLPAVFFLLIGTFVIAVIWAPDEVARTRGTAAAAVAYVTNWYFVFHQESYFEAIGRPPLLQHLWSLAVEEQFYLVWPLLFVLAIKLRQRLAFAMALLGVIGSTALLWYLYNPAVDPSRVYYGTDTRAAELLVGAALAFLWEPDRLRSTSDDIPRLMRWLRDHPRVPLLLDGLGIIALTGIGLSFWYFGQYNPDLYQGGFLLVALITALLIAVVAHPRALRVPAALSAPMLHYVGLRSYSIYLWHWPIFLVTRPHLDLALDGPALVALRLSLTIALAEISYRYVETPFRSGAVGRAWRAWRQSGDLRGYARRLNPRWQVASGTAFSALILLGVVVARAQPPGPPAFLPVETVQVTRESTPTATPTPPPVTPETEVGLVTDLEPLRPHHPDTITPTTPAEPTATPTPEPTPVVLPTVTAIGDSVMIGAASAMQETIPNLSIDAAIGMTPASAIEILRAHRDAGTLGDVIILHIGNNGLFTESEFDQVMEVIGDSRTLMVVNLKVPRPWEGPNNGVLADGAARYENAMLLDWHGLSKDHPEFFWNDGIHLRPDGAAHYTQLLMSHLPGMPTETVADEAPDQEG